MHLDISMYAYAPLTHERAKQEKRPMEVIVVQNMKTKTKTKSTFQELRELLIASGWERHFVKQNLKKQNLDDETPAYWLESYAFLWFESTNSNLSFTERLKRMGMHPLAARYYSALVQPLADSYGPNQLLDSVLDIILSRNPFIPNVSLGEWLYALNASTPNSTWTTVDIHGIPTRILNSKRKRSIVLPPAAPGSTFLFHATSWYGALNLRRGINLNKGKRCLDFGFEPSFYTTPDYNVAYEWTKKKSHGFHGQLAIVVYAMACRPKSYQEHHFEDANEDWARLVSQSRECDESTTCVLDSKDFVIGPMANNPKSIVNKTQTPSSHTPIRIQWAAKSTRAAKFMDARFGGIVWFPATQHEATRVAPQEESPSTKPAKTQKTSQ